MMTEIQDLDGVLLRRTNIFENKNSCFSVITFLILSILSACLCFPMVFMSTYGVIESKHHDEDYNGQNFHKSNLNQTFQEPRYSNALVRCE